MRRKTSPHFSYSVFNSVFFFGSLCIIPTAHITYKVACDTAYTLKLCREKLILKVNEISVNFDIKIFQNLGGIFFFDVPCSPVRLTGLAVLVLSMFMMGKWGVTAQEEDEVAQEEKKRSNKSIWLLFTLFAFFVAGSSQCLFNLPSYLIRESGSAGLDTIYFRLGVNSTGTFCFFALSRLWNKNSFNGKGTLGGIVLLTLCSFVTVGFLCAGLDTLAACGAGAIAYPVSLGSSIAGFLIYTAIKLKERLSLPALGGVILCFTGIVLLAF